MEQEQRLPRETGGRKPNHLEASCARAIEDELWEAVEKLEHRAETLTSFSQRQRSSGHPDLAEAYGKKAVESKEHARSIRKLLIFPREDG